MTTNNLYLFASPVTTLILDDFEAVNTQLKALIYEQESNDIGLQKSNFGGWHSKDNMLEWAPEQARLLLQAAMSACAPLTADIHPAGKRDFEFNANMWANINRKGHGNNAHAHPGCLWSCAYYVDDGLSETSEYVGGELMLEDPRFPMNSMYMPCLVLRGDDGEPQRAQHSVTPKTGMMVIFPSWLRHSVRPYKGENDRISVAFNLMVEQV